ncbi:MAG: SPFH domain-containing protein [Candidatus Saccharimonadales bacterium]
MSDRQSGGIDGKVVGVIATVLLIWLFGFLINYMSSRSTPQSGEIGVVRNGSSISWAPDWFDNHNIRGIVANGSGNTFIGLGSDVHYYPVGSQQRFFRLQTCYGDGNAEVPCGGADDVAITVPTSDGVEVGIEGTFYLNTAFDDSQAGTALLKDFDTQYGTRTFGDKGLHVWDGTNGWKTFLASIVEPVIANNLRQTVVGVTCAELVSSCALVQNNGSVTQTVSLAHGKVNQNSVNAVQDKINTGLQRDLNTTLGGAYFTHIRFNLTKVDLPDKVQSAINDAQAAFAQVSQAQAQVAQAKLQAKANVERQAGYTKCPTCALIDQTKAIPSSITVWAPGSRSSVALGK